MAWKEVREEARDQDGAPVSDFLTSIVNVIWNEKSPFGQKKVFGNKY